MRFWVEPVPPGYDASFEPEGEDESPAEVRLDVEVAADRWAPLQPRTAPAASVAFVDGVRRVDTRIWIEHPDDFPTLGLCASLAAGVVRSEGDEVRIDRRSSARAAFGATDVDCGDGIFYRGVPAADAEPTAQHLYARIQDELDRLELEMAQAVSGTELVVLDGHLRDRERIAAAVGYLKSQHRRYLKEHQAQERVVGQLRAGERTPIFLLETSWPRYTWYLRLPGAGGHPWSGIVRCELALDAPDPACFADVVSATLPRFASRPHKDARAPQNLVPIGSLEQYLRHGLGDQALMERAIRRAASET
jgi:hypothetical protein